MELPLGRTLRVGFVVVLLVSGMDSQRIRPWKRHSGKRIILHPHGFYRTSEHKTVRKQNTHKNNTSLDGKDATMKRNWFFNSLDSCLAHLGDKAYSSDGKTSCNGTWDTVLCWPAAPAGTLARHHCPPLRGLDPSRYAYKRCSLDGRWEGKYLDDFSMEPAGWTNYSDCYTALAKKQMDKFYGNKHEWERQLLREIVGGTRTMEMVGLCLSLVSLTLSLIIFCYFRSLKCNRTRIHRNLFIAVIVQVVINLIMYIDQYLDKTVERAIGTISSTRIVCEMLYTLMEYSKTVKFMWMLIEGIYLHNMIAISVFSGRPNYILYYSIGWGLPVLITLAWAITTGLVHHEKCWWGYTFQPIFWILEGPRAAVIAVNIFFLLNIIRVLVTKLRESHSTEALQVRQRMVWKAVKAAIVLLPLLGITNFINMVPEPSDSAVKFGVWSYTSHFLITFQGFFIALLYCFLNGEVQSTIKKHWERFQQSRGGRYTSGKRRLSRTFSVFTSVTEMPPQQEEIRDQNNKKYCKVNLDSGENHRWSRRMRWSRRGTRNSETSETEEVTPNNNGSLSNGHPANSSDTPVNESMV
ncbi:PDF receptor-like isoform X7 [Lineus longissimus]|uniref:PDF receptor-like isoform X7 n=1 Tax=Lineus longissimus TaxID=88925 RepID=UPI00315C5041